MAGAERNYVMDWFLQTKENKFYKTKTISHISRRVDLYEGYKYRYRNVDQKQIARQATST